MNNQGKLSQWLQQRCQREHLSLRGAADKTGLSHTTITNIINKKSEHPSLETIQKLARAFGDDGSLPLEDHLLTLAGYRSEQDASKKGYMGGISLLSPEYQHVIEVLVTELAKLEGIEIPKNNESVGE